MIRMCALIALDGLEFRCVLCELSARFSFASVANKVYVRVRMIRRIRMVRSIECSMVGNLLSVVVLGFLVPVDHTLRSSAVAVVLVRILIQPFPLLMLTLPS